MDNKMGILEDFHEINPDASVDLEELSAEITSYFASVSREELIEELESMGLDVIDLRVDLSPGDKVKVIEDEFSSLAQSFDGKTGYVDSVDEYIVGINNAEMFQEVDKSQIKTVYNIYFSEAGVTFPFHRDSLKKLVGEEEDKCQGASYIELLLQEVCSLRKMLKLAAQDIHELDGTSPTDYLSDLSTRNLEE